MPRRDQPQRREIGSKSPGLRSEAVVVSIEPRISLLDRIRARPGLKTALAAAVPVGFVTALLFIPYVLLLVQSFWRLRGGAIVHELTLDNYRRLFGTPLYPNTILF